MRVARENVPRRTLYFAAAPAHREWRRIRNSGAAVFVAASVEALNWAPFNPIETFRCPLFPWLLDWARPLASHWVEGNREFRVNRRRGIKSGELLSACTITSSDFLPHTLGLVQNLLKVHSGELAINILALDSVATNFLPSNPRLTAKFLSPQDLWSDSELSHLRRRSIAQLAYTSKARLLAHTLRSSPNSAVYLDSDIFLFRSPSHLPHYLQSLKGAALLFPHWTEQAARSRQHGHFNAGMLVVRDGAERFLNWWSEMCFLKCAQERGFFDDQGYLDLAPLLFPECLIYRNGDENLGHWNLGALGVWRNAEGQLLLPNGRPIGSLHAASGDPLRAFEIKTAWDQLCFMLSERTLPSPPPLFLEAVMEQQSPYRMAVEGLLRARRKMRSLVPAFQVSAAPTRGKPFYEFYARFCRRIRGDMQTAFSSDGSP